MSVKERLEKQMQRTAEDMAAAKYIAPAPEAGEDEALKAALVRVKAGDHVAAYRTKNGALVQTRPHTDSEKPEVLR